MIIVLFLLVYKLPEDWWSFHSFLPHQLKDLSSLFIEIKNVTTLES